MTESFITHDVVPDKYPEEVGGGGGKVGDLTITWKVGINLEVKYDYLR